MTEDARETGPESPHELEWTQEGIPRSLRFGDTYYSRHGGLAETGHVFIGWNELPARWPQMRHCLIAELGFGTGLNFLETVRWWREHKAADATLHFLSFEAWPMSREEMARAHAPWPELAALSPRLVELWSPREAVVDAQFAPDIRLTVHLADANMALRALSFAADAWYLDGFAPARNPQMWSAELMAQVFGHTIPGGTFATYAAAGFVRRNLEAAGFAVERQPGFAGKREMLRGVKRM